MTAFTALLLASALDAWVGLFGFLVINATLPGGIFHFQIRGVADADDNELGRKGSMVAAGSRATKGLMRCYWKASFIIVIARMVWWTAKNWFSRRAKNPGAARAVVLAVRCGRSCWESAKRSFADGVKPD